MNTSELVSEILENTKSPDHDAKAVIRLLNQGILEVASGGAREHGRARVPPLPDLFTSGTVTVLSGANSGSMPSTFHRSMRSVFDSQGYSLKQYWTHTELLKRYSGQNGDPEAYCLVGSTLWVGPAPTSDTTLTVYFHRYPTELSTVGSTIDGIPTGFQRRILLNYVSAEIFAVIEQGLDGANPDTMKHQALYQLALSDLERDLPAEDKEPINIGDSDYGEEYIQ